MRQKVLLALLFILTTTLAGCVDGDEPLDPGDPDAVPQSADDPAYSGDTGAMTGTVASVTFWPLGGATVELLGTTHKTTVAENGAYTLNNIPPGRYTVWVVATGYAADQFPVDIIANTVAKVDVRLEPLADDEPYWTEEERTGLIQQAVAWRAEVPTQGCLVVDEVAAAALKTCSGVRYAEDGEITINITEDVKTLIVVLAWDPAGPLGKNLKLDVLCPEVPRSPDGSVLEPDHVCFFKNPQTTSPITIRVDAEHWETNGYTHTGNWAARAFATPGLLGTGDSAGVDVGVAYQQAFTFYWSLHYKQPAPADFSPLPDA